MLDPVLDRRVMRKGRGLTMQLADKEARPFAAAPRPCRRRVTHADSMPPESAIEADDVSPL